MKAITTASKHLTLPLPDNLQRTIDSYVSNQSSPDEAESDRLQEDLLDIYEKHISDRPDRLAPFLRILRNLKPVLQGTHRSLQWWDKLSTPILTHLGTEKELADDATETVLEVLLFDEDLEEGRIHEAQDTSDGVAGSLLAIWLENTMIAEEKFDQYAVAVVKQAQLLLTEFGKKKPRVRPQAFVYSTLLRFTEIPRIDQQYICEEGGQNLSARSVDPFLPPSTTAPS